MLLNFCKLCGWKPFIPIRTWLFPKVRTLAVVGLWWSFKKIRESCALHPRKSFGAVSVVWRSSKAENWLLPMVLIDGEDVDHLTDKCRLPSYLVVGIEKFWNENLMTNCSMNCQSWTRIIGHGIIHFPKLTTHPAVCGWDLSLFTIFFHYCCLSLIFLISKNCNELSKEKKSTSWKNTEEFSALL